ncbi:hypothetical protein BL250_09945 [Erwinia sp. OLTSP20]|uniref:DedA family protein n=1 Tax=unclassified Erwinia TaxID=2622719 RepID=UPI000C178391|nr:MULTISPECIES: DedA family protein [unclassified Erwinia]PIJ49731.1 hypothetical protein BV501_11075 [Erwinia sp. OAMSP11]PIJ70829.1 hypothetical protein BK416_12265 [Erwinia sp. OLSSP12]PIJ80195.1 hypothetical protein BLD47_11130 [Erwinia sp. OLCASP19]PIJ82318.1 hypothetical protein BLD46_10880 [Erwinia sp. OLMTSP26]PIJ85005.1 hypothetical protein BLD49_10990 [Erwinia sp. OLMDSP33]
MEAWLEHLITQSAGWALFAIALVVFFESLALLGLLMPGTVLMATFGALIGSDKLALYPAWLVATLACMAGDWVSWLIGQRFKGPLHRCSLIQRYRHLMDKAEQALHQHSLFTIIIGRFVGPTRAVIPLVAGMLELPASRFVLPNLVACLFWPPLYFMPGILAGVAIDIPSDAQSGLFKWLLLVVALLVWLALWLCWRWLRGEKQADWASGWLCRSRLRWLAPLMLLVATLALIAGAFHPLTPTFLHLLRQVFIGG